MAGLAIITALRAVERVGTGSIGGFVSLVAISGDGKLLRTCTQDGGANALFGGADIESADIPAEIATAPTAALMSSGPNRPEPLSQFTPGEAGVGLVTGHRLPNESMASGTPLNVAVLREMKKGKSPSEATQVILDANPDADAGVIAVNCSGVISVQNSELVNSRPDIGSQNHVGQSGELSVGVLHNAIFPHRPLASLAVETALHCVAPINRANGNIRVSVGVPVIPSEKNRVYITDSQQVREIHVAQHSLAQQGERHTAAIPFQTEVVAAGRVMGHTVQEPYCIVKDGYVARLAGAEQIEIAVQWTDSKTK